MHYFGQQCVVHFHSIYAGTRHNACTWYFKDKGGMTRNGPEYKATQQVRFRAGGLTVCLIIGCQVTMRFKCDLAYSTYCTYHGYKYNCPSPLF